MSEPAKVFEDRETPGQWCVESSDDNGRRKVSIFTGPTARREALRYAMREYGHFREVDLGLIASLRNDWDRVGTAKQPEERAEIHAHMRWCLEELMALVRGLEADA